MGYNQFSKIVEPRPYTPEIDVNVYGKGLLMNEQNMKNTQQNLNNAADNFLNIQTNIPQDAQVLNQRKQEFQNAVKGLNLSNLNNPQTVSQLNQLITKFSTDPDILGIAQRANSLNKEIKTKQEYESKGQRYTSPLIDEAEDYINQGAYVTQKRFNKTGWVSPDTTKAMQDAVKAATKKVYNPKTGYVESVAKPGEVSAAFYEIIKNNPGYQKDLDYSFQKETKDVNWDDKGQEFVQNKLNKLQEQIYQAQAQGDQESFEMATHELNRLSKLSNPSLIGNQLKDQYFQNYINTQLEQVGYANDVSDFEKIERDPIDMKLYEHQLQRQDDLYKLQLKTGVFPNQGESQQSYIQRLSQEAQKKDLEIAQAKSDIIEQRQKDVAKNTNELKIQYLGEQGKFKAVTNKGGNEMIIKGEKYDKNTLLNSLDDSQTVQNILEGNPSKFGLDCFSCTGKAVDSGSLHQDKQGNWVYQNDSYGNDDVYTISKDALKAYILDKDVEVDLTNGGVKSGGEVDEEVYKPKEEPSKTDTTNNSYNWNSGDSRANLPTMSVKEYNKAKGKNYTKQQIEMTFGKQYNVVD